MLFKRILQLSLVLVLLTSSASQWQVVAFMKNTAVLVHLHQRSVDQDAQHSHDFSTGETHSHKHSSDEPEHGHTILDPMSLAAMSAPVLVDLFHVEVRRDIPLVFAFPASQSAPLSSSPHVEFRPPIT
jgi:hypothetical protein